MTPAPQLPGRRSAFALTARGAVLRRIATTLAASIVAMSTVRSDPPTSGTVVAGSASFNQSGATTTITASNNAIIDYNSFNIPAGYTVQFVQPSSTSRVLNRVIGGNISEIFGTLQANGIVYLVNPAGIYFGPNSYIDVGGLYAAAGNMSNRDFLAQSDRFTALNGSVVNAGTIHGGSVGLFGGTVSNVGTISAPHGLVALAAGDEILLGERGGRVYVQANKTSAPAPTGVTNTGTIDARGGQALLAAGDLYSVAIQQSGTILAREARLQGQGSGEVWQNGRIDVSNTQSGATGGQVEVTGEKVGLGAGSTIDASGAAGGGQALIGGDYQGANADVRNATATYIDAAATVRADATENGDGGKVVIWSDGTTRYFGSLSARGGLLGGNGGLAEVSGKQVLGFSGQADLTAPSGSLGSLLLDPNNLTINNTGTEAGFGSAGGVFTATASDAVLKWSSFAGIAGNVVIQTNGAGTQSGNISITESPASLNRSGDLTFDTTGTSGVISLSAAVQNSGTGAIIFKSGSGGIQLGANLTATNITLDSSGAVAQTAGKVTASSTLTLTGGGDVGSSANPLAVGAGAGSIALSNAGNVHVSRASGALVISGSATGDLGATSSAGINGSSLSIGGTTTLDAGGLLNVAGAFTGAVTVSNASAVTINAGSTALTLNAISTAGDVNVTAGNLGLDDLAGANVTLSSGGAVTQTAGKTVTATGLLSFAGNGAFGSSGSPLSISASSLSLSNGGNVFVNRAGGALALSGSVGGNFGATTAGDITGTGLSFSGTTTLDPGGSSSPVNIGGTFGGAVTVSNAGAVTIDGGSNPLSLGAISTAGAIQATGSTITLGGDLTATSGNLTLTGNVALPSSSTHSLSTSAGNGNISITGSVSGNATSLTLAAGAGTIGIGGSISGGLDDLTISSSGGTTFSNSVTLDNNLTLGATGNTTFSSSVVAGGTIQKSAGAGTASFSSGGSANQLSLSGTSFSFGGNFTTTNTATLTGNVSVTGAKLSAGGAITVNGNTTLTSVSSTRGALESTGSSVTVTGSVTIGPNEGVGEITANSSISLGTVQGTDPIQPTRKSLVNRETLYLTGDTATYSTLSPNQVRFILDLSSAGLTTYTGYVEFTRSISFSGIVILNDADLVALGNTNLTLNNTLRLGTGDSTISTTNGALTVKDIVTVAAGGTNSIGLFTDNLTMNGTITTAGTVQLAPAAGGALSIGNSASGGLHLTSAMLNKISDGTAAIVLGRTDQNNAVTINNGSALTFSDPVTIETGSGGSITLNGSTRLEGTNEASIALLGGSVSLADSDGGNTIHVANGGITLAGQVTLQDNVTLGTDGSGQILLSGSSSTITGSKDLTLNASSGSIAMQGDVGSPGGLLTVFDALSSTVSTRSVYSTAQYYTGSLTLNGNAVLRGSTLSFPSAWPTIVGGGNSLTLDFPSLTINGSALTGLSSFTLSQAGSLNGTLTTTGSQTYGGAVTLTGNTVLSGTTESFSGVVGGGYNLTLTHTSPIALAGATFSGVGAFTDNGGGATSLSGTFTNASQTLSNAVSLTGATTLAGATTFGSTLNGAQTLTINGNAIFNGAIGNSTSLTSLTVTGTTSVGAAASSITTSGLQSYGSTMTLAADTSLSAGSSLSLGGVTGGGHDLSLSVTGGNITVGSGYTGIQDFSVTANQTNLSGSITTSGSQTFTSNVALTGASSLTSSTNQPITITGAVTGANSLTIATGGTTQIGGDVGTLATPLTVFNVSSGPARLHSIYALSQNYGGAITLLGNATLKGTSFTFGGGSPNIAGGGFDLTLDAPSLTLNGTNLTGIKNFTAVQATQLSGSLTTTGSQTFSAAPTLTGTTALTGTTFSFPLGIIGNGQSLTLTNTGSASLTAFTGLTGLTLSGGGTTSLSGSITAATQTYNNPVTLTGTTTLTGAVTFGSTVTGTQALTINGSANFNGAITTSLTSLNITGATSLGSAATAITTTGLQSYGGLLTLGGDTTLTAGGTLTFAGVSGGGHDLTINNPGATVAIGAGFTGIGNLTVTATQTNLSGSVTTSGTQTFTSNVNLTGTTTLTSSTDQDVSISGTVNGANALTISTGGNSTIGGNVGSTTAPSGLSVTAGPVTFNGSAVTTSGNQSYSGLVTAAPSGSTITFTGAQGQFSGGLSAAGKTVIMNFTDLIYQTAPFSMGTLQVTTTSKTQILGAGITTTGAQTYTGPVELSGGADLTGSSLTFNGATDILAAGTTLTANAGGISFGNTFNASAASSLSATTTLSFANAATFTGATTLQSGSTSTFNGLITLSSGSLGVTASTATFNGRIVGPGGLSVTGNAAFNGWVGRNTVDAPLASLNVTGTTTVATDLGVGRLYTTGAQTYGGTVTLAGSTFLQGSGATFNGAVEGPGGLDAVTTPTPVTFNGTVGATTALSSLNLSTATANGGTLRTSGAQTYSTRLDLGADTTLSAGTLTLNRLEGAYNLTLGVTGLSSIGVIGQSAPFGSGTGAALTLNSTGNTTFSGLVNLASGIQQSANSLLTFNGDVTVAASGSDSVFNGSVAFNGSHFTSGRAITIGNSLTDTFTVGAAGGLTIDTSTTGSAVSVAASTTLNGPLTVTAGAGAISFGPIDGNQDLTLTSTTGITLGGALGLTTPLGVLSLNGPVTLNAGTIRTNGSQTYGTLTLSSDTTFITVTPLTSFITLNGPVDGAHALTLSSPTVNVNAALGATAPLSSLTINGGAANLGAGATQIRTSGTQTYSSDVIVAGTTSISAPTTSFNALVDGPGSLSLTGNAAFASSIGATTALTSLDVTGATSMAGSLVKTTGMQAYHGALTFTHDLQLQGTTVTLDNAIDSAFALDVQGNAVFGGAIGQTTALASLNVSGTTQLNGAGIRTNGAQAYGGAFTLGADATLSTLTPVTSTITFGGTINGAHTLALSSPTVNLNGTVGNSTALTSLSITGGLASLGAGASSLHTTGIQTYSSRVTLAGATSINASTTNFGSSLDGPGSLTITGGATFAASVGATTALSSLDVTGPATINGSLMKTSGTQAYHGALSFSNNLQLQGSVITIDNAVDSNLRLDVVGNAVFGGAVGQVTPLAALSVSGSTTLLGGSVTTVGTQTYAQQISLSGNTTLTGSQVNISGKVNGALSLTIVGDGLFGDLVGDITPLTSLSVSGNTTLSAPAIVTTGAQTYSRNVSLAGNTTLTGSLVTIGGAVDGALDLVIHGSANLGGAIGQTTALNSLTVTGNTALNGSAITTVNAQDYQSVVTLGRDVALTAGSVRFGGAVDGPYTLTISGPTTFNGVVGGTSPLAALSVTGGATFNTASVTTTGLQTYSGATTLALDTTLTGTTISFNGTLDGAHALAIHGGAAFGGTVGGVAPLTSLDVTGATALSGIVRTSGNQRYAGAVTLGGASALTGSTVSFLSTINGPYDLGIVGNASLSAPVGGLVPLNALSVTGSTHLLASAVTTTGAQAYLGALNLSGDSTLTGSRVRFGGAVAGAYNLKVAGGAVFESAVGASTPLASLEVTGTSALNGASITTSGEQDYRGAATLGGDTTLRGSRIVFGSTLDGGYGLIIDGGVSFGGPVGGSTPLRDLAINGPITLTAGTINTTGTQTYGGAVTLAADNTLGASLVKFTGTVDGPFALTISNDAAFGGEVGGFQPLTDLTVNGQVSFNQARVRTSGTQTYGGAFDLTGDATLVGSRIRLKNTVNGNHLLTIQGQVEFGSDIGVSAPLAGLLISGSTDFGGTRIATAGAQNYGGAFTFQKDATLSGSLITFGGAVDGAHSLTLQGGAIINGAVGSINPLTSLTISGETTLNGSSVKTVGEQNYRGATTLAADENLSGSLVTFGAALDGAHGLSIDGDADFEGAVGAASPLTALTVKGKSQLRGGSFSTSGDQTYGGAITLLADSRFSGAKLTFGGALDGAFGLSIDRANQTIFNGSLGGTTVLKSITVSGPVVFNGAQIRSSGAQIWSGSFTLGKNTDLAASSVKFGGAIDGANTLTIKGDAQFDGAIGGATPLSALSVEGAIALNGHAVTTSGDQLYKGAVTLGGDMTVKTSGGSVTFDSTVNAGSNAALSVDAENGFAAFNGDVGGASPLGSLSVFSHDMRIAQTTTSGDQSYRSAAGAVMELTGNLKSSDGNISFSSVRSEVPAIATIFHNIPGDLTIDTPNGDFSMGSFERFLVSGGKTSADEGGNLNLTVGGKATLGDLAVSKVITVRAGKIDFVGSYMQATDIFLLTTGGTLLPVSDMSFRGAASGASDTLVSLSTRNGTPFAAASPNFILRLMDPSLFKNNRIAPEKFPTLTATGSLLFEEFNVFPVFTASSRTNLSEVLGGAIPTATVDVQPESAISSAVRDQLVLLGIFARQLTPAEKAGRRAQRTIYEQVIPTEAREPSDFTVADGRISQETALEAVRLYETIFTKSVENGGKISRIPDIQQSLARAYQAFRREAPTAEPSAFASFIEGNQNAPAVQEVKAFFHDTAKLFRAIESLGLTDQEITVSKTVLLRPLRVVGLPSSVLRRMIESINQPSLTLKTKLTPPPS